MNRLISRIITSIWKKFESVLTGKEIKRLNAKEFIPVLIRLAQHDSIYYNRQNEISRMVWARSYEELFCFSWVVSSVVMRVRMAMGCDSVINDFFIISFHRSIWMLRAEKILYFITWLNFNFITPLGITDSYKPFG